MPENEMPKPGEVVPVTKEQLEALKQEAIDRIRIPQLEVVRLFPDAQLPHLAYDESAAYDLSAYMLTESGRPNNTVLAPRSTRLVSTGLALRPPPGHLVLICSRSGMAKRSIFVANAPGVVDPTYTGEIKILLYNGGHTSEYVRHGDRVAQALVVPFAAVKLKEVNELPPTLRGAKGFGSSGE